MGRRRHLKWAGSAGGPVRLLAWRIRGLGYSLRSIQVHVFLALGRAVSHQTLANGLRGRDPLAGRRASHRCPACRLGLRSRARWKFP